MTIQEPMECPEAHLQIYSKNDKLSVFQQSSSRLIDANSSTLNLLIENHTQYAAPSQQQNIQGPARQECEEYIQKILTNIAWYAQQIFERLLTSSLLFFQTLYKPSSSNSILTHNTCIPRYQQDTKTQKNPNEWTKVYHT